jgi:FtsP/CotA-like multicopper oxidase with cupredoxin domain
VASRKADTLPALVSANGSLTNNTNLHYHGLHVSPQAPGDDSIDMVAAPG